jgi:hypothetical protein
METEAVYKILKTHSILTWLIARKNLIPQLQEELLNYKMFVLGGGGGTRVNIGGRADLYTGLYTFKPTYVRTKSNHN